MSSQYTSIADDLEWLRNEWWLRSETPSEADIRRGSAILRRLLVENVIQMAWGHHGFKGQPKLCGPDITALAAIQNLRLDHAVSLVAGGGRLNGVDLSMIGGFRVFNPTTGKGPDDDSGFAVTVGSIARVAKGATPGPLDPLVDRSWYLKDYLDAPGAVRRGKQISRRDVIKFVANFAGGVHHNRIWNSRRKNKTQYELISELEGRIRADIRDGLYFELLSIGQAIGRSSDMQLLVNKIRD